MPDTVPMSHTKPLASWNLHSRRGNPQFPNELVNARISMAIRTMVIIKQWVGIREMLSINKKPEEDVAVSHATTEEANSYHLCLIFLIYKVEKITQLPPQGYFED